VIPFFVIENGIATIIYDEVGEAVSDQYSFATCSKADWKWQVIRESGFGTS
jgi:hypothetical protein